MDGKDHLSDSKNSTLQLIYSKIRAHYSICNNIYFYFTFNILFQELNGMNTNHTKCEMRQSNFLEFFLTIFWNVLPISSDSSDRIWSPGRFQVKRTRFATQLFNKKNTIVKIIWMHVGIDTKRKETLGFVAFHTLAIQ